MLLKYFKRREKNYSTLRKEIDMTQTEILITNNTATDIVDVTCPVGRVLNVLKGKFTVEILSAILNGHLHYGQLLRSVSGINPRTLAQRLHDLENVGVLSRTVLPTNPPQVEYQLTPKGQALRKIANEMKAWDEYYN